MIPSELGTLPKIIHM